MKKVFIAACMLLGFGGIASAQTTAAATTQDAKTEMSAVKKDRTNAKVVKMKSLQARRDSLTKADGTADMRFKANKNRARATADSAYVPRKKDGTADMRYKANKNRTKKVKKS